MKGQIYYHRETGHRARITNICIFGRGKWIGEIFTLTDKEGRQSMYNRAELNTYFAPVQ